MAAIKSKYKRFNGVEWEEYYFETSVDQVIGLADSIKDNETKLSTNDSTATSGKYISRIQVSDHGLTITKADLPTGFSGNYDDLSNKPTIDQLLGNLSTLGFVKRTGTNSYVIDTSTYQPLDADLTAIAGLSETSGFLKKTSSNTWSLDTSVYLTAITKAQVEAVLTGTITTHTHNASDIVEDASHRFVTDTQISTWDDKVDKVAGKGLSTNDYTTVEKNKLSGIEAGAQVNPTATQVKSLYESNSNTNAFTDAEKTKLSSLESSKFIGQYISLALLQTAHPTPSVGSYAFVDPGFGSDVIKYIWDSNDTKWVLSGEVNQEITSAQVKTLYESNEDTNAFTDADKSKLSGIQAGAQANTVTSVAGKTGAVTLAAGDIPFDGSDTNYLTVEAEVEGAIKELDARVKTNVDGKLDKNTNITGATKTKITYDSKGLVTAGADLVEADIPALSASKITQTTSARFVTDTEKTTWNNKGR